MTPHADYSRIAASYDTGRKLSEQNTEIWLDLIAKAADVWSRTRLLDLGCGTGRFAIPIAMRFGCDVVGADSSPAMLAKAQAKEHSDLVTWEYHDAEAIAYPVESFDIVFMSHLLHHIAQPQKLLDACFRILRSSGALVIRYGALEHISSDPEHTFFPQVLDIDNGRCLTIARTEQLLRSSGFTAVASTTVRQRTYETADDRLTAAQARHTSVMTLISDDAFAEGIATLGAQVRRNPDDPWLLHDDMTVSAGRKDPTVAQTRRG